MELDAVVFDLGGVVLDWDPAHLYRQLLEDEAEVQSFLTSVCTREWHLQHDAGRPMAETIPELSLRHPEHASLIAAWRERYVDMVGDYVPGTVAVIEELASRTRLLALTNMPAEVVGELRDRFTALDLFEGMVVSGEERIMKPDSRIFELLTRRFDLEPGRTLFVDDVEANVAAAREHGLRAVQFHSAGQLRAELTALGVLAEGTTS